VGDATHDLSGIVGQLDITGGGQAGDTLNVDARIAITGLTGRIYTVGLAAGTAGVSGLGMTIGLNYTGIDAFNLTLGKGGDNLFVEGTNTATHVIDAYLGDDVINIGSISGVTRVYGDRITAASGVTEKGFGGKDTIRVNYGQDGRQTFANGVAALLTVGGGEDDGAGIRGYVDGRACNGVGQRAAQVTAVCADAAEEVVIVGSEARAVS
jgi:hypothetical protein